MVRSYISSAPSSVGIGGSTGSTDNRLLRADGTGGSTLQNSAIGCDDSGNLTGVGTINSTTPMATDYSNATPSPGVVMAKALAVNFNATGDTSITITLPSGFTRFRIQTIFIAHASASLTTTTIGVFTAAAGGGVAIVASGTSVTVNTASENTANNLQSLAIAPITSSFNVSALFFRVINPQGSAATADVILLVQPLP